MCIRDRYVRPQGHRQPAVGRDEFVLARAGCLRGRDTSVGAVLGQFDRRPLQIQVLPSSVDLGEVPPARVVHDGVVVRRGALRDTRDVCRVHPVRERQSVGDRLDLCPLRGAVGCGRRGDRVGGGLVRCGGHGLLVEAQRRAQMLSGWQVVGLIRTRA